MPIDPATGRYVEDDEEGIRSGSCERCHMPTRYRLCAFCGESFVDPETIKLWNAARQSLRDLSRPLRVLEEATGQEIDE